MSHPVNDVFDDTPTSPTAAAAAALSACVDGEADDSAWDSLWATEGSDGAVHATWHRYHLIGDVLRSGQGSAAWARSLDALDSGSAVSFAQRVTSIAQEQGPMTLISPPNPPHAIALPVAANEGVFRWKMVAGLASFTAVAGIVWGVAGGTPQGNGALLAVAPVSAPAVQVADSSPVLVTTPHGQVLRDARLQELMQTHRQLGGVSALQVPAGFLRTSTLDGHSR